MLKLWQLFLESITGRGSSSGSSRETVTSETEHSDLAESSLTLADQMRHPAKINVLLETAREPGHFLVGDVSGRVVGYTISASSRPK